MSSLRTALAASSGLVVMAGVSACGSTDSAHPGDTVLEAILDNQPLDITWEDNPSVAQLKAVCAQESLHVDLAAYGGFELVGNLGHHVVSDDQSLTATEGDVVLYQSKSIVFMTGTNRWEYTRLGKVSSPDIERLTHGVGIGSATLELRCSTPQENTRSHEEGTQ